MLPSFATQTVTVLRANVVTDNRGNSRPDWANADEHALARCLLSPAAGTEIVANRDEVTTVWTLFAPADADLLPTDRVRTDDGAVYEVVGSVQRHATGVLDHTKALLTRWEG